jgi:hypothetical protein
MTKNSLDGAEPLGGPLASRNTNRQTTVTRRTMPQLDAIYIRYLLTKHQSVVQSFHVQDPDLRSEERN